MLLDCICARGNSPRSGLGLLTAIDANTERARSRCYAKGKKPAVILDALVLYIIRVCLYTEVSFIKLIPFSIKVLLRTVTTIHITNSHLCSLPSSMLHISSFPFRIIYVTYAYQLINNLHKRPRIPKNSPPKNHIITCTSDSRDSITPSYPLRRLSSSRARLLTAKWLHMPTFAMTKFLSNFSPSPLLFLSVFSLVRMTKIFRN